MKTSHFLLTFLLGSIFFLASCSDENRSLLERQQIPVAFRLTICDSISPYLALLNENLMTDLDSKSSDSIYLLADIEVCLFGDPNKIKNHIVPIRKEGPDKWITDTISLINPGVGSHTIRRIILFSNNDPDHPLYASICGESPFSSKCSPDEQMPLLIDMREFPSFSTLAVYPATLFSTWMEGVNSFGYDKWNCSRPNESALSFLISDSEEMNSDFSKRRLLTGRFYLARKSMLPADSIFTLIEEKIFVQELKTTVSMKFHAGEDELFLLQFCIPDKENPQLIISDTLTSAQLFSFQQSGFWISEPDDPEIGTIKFDLAQTRKQACGLLCRPDSLANTKGWTPYYTKK